jgi:hypothetical protein
MPSHQPALLAVFEAEIRIIGVNPYVLLPAATLQKIFAHAGRDKGPIPVRGALDGHSFIQTLVKFAGAWRLYLNGPMLRACSKGVGDHVRVRIAYDLKERFVGRAKPQKKALNKVGGSCVLVESARLLSLGEPTDERAADVGQCRVRREGQRHPV